MVRQSPSDVLNNCSAGGLEDGPRSNTQYMALFNNMLHRMRFSKFLEIVSCGFDEEVSSFSFGSY